MALEYLHTNNASSNLATAITTVAQTTVRVTSGTGVLFPTPGVNQGFFVTVEDRRTGRMEIMLCTSKSTDTLTVQRGKQGTTPQTFPVGVNVSNRITAEILNEFVSATIDMIPASRIPPITDAMMAASGIDANKITTGVLAVGRIPVITNAMLAASGFDAAKLTVGIIPDARLPVPMAATHLPAIPPALLTSVPAASLTGTIAGARLPMIPPGNLNSVPAASLTGTIAEARFPTAFSITGGMTAGNLIITGSPGNASIVGYLNVGGAIAGDVITAQLYHPQYGGYVRIGSYSTDYGAGIGRFYYDAKDVEFVFVSHASSAVASVHAAEFRGSGAGLTGVVSPVAGAIDSMRMLLGPTGGHTSGTVYLGTNLANPYFQVDNTTTNLDVVYGSGPSGHWRAMQSATGGSNERVLGLFTRVD